MAVLASSREIEVFSDDPCAEAEDADAVLQIFSQYDLEGNDLRQPIRVEIEDVLYVVTYKAVH